MKSQMSKEEYERISERARVARLILNNADFQFIRDYINNGIISVELAILGNTIHDVTERVTIAQSQELGFPTKQKEFFTPKKQQEDQLKGQRIWIRQFLADLQLWANEKTELDKQISKGMVILEGGNKKDLNYAGPKLRGKK